MPNRSLATFLQQVLQIIPSHLHRPIDHLNFSKSCPQVFRMYTAEYYQDLCDSYGFGRPLSVAKTQSWQATFEKVVKHFKDCKVPTCRQFGVALPADCYSRARLKAMGMRKENDLRDKPLIHPFLKSLGKVRLKHFVRGRFCYLVGMYDFQGDVACGGAVYKQDRGVDWDQEDGVKADDAYLERLADHPILASAFACQPPSTTAVLKFPGMGRHIFTHSGGVTVEDVVHESRKLLEGKITQNDIDAQGGRFRYEGVETDQSDIGVQDRWSILRANEESDFWRAENCGEGVGNLLAEYFKVSSDGPAAVLRFEQDKNLEHSTAYCQAGIEQAQKVKAEYGCNIAVQ